MNSDGCPKRVECNLDLIVNADSQWLGGFERDHQRVWNRLREFRRSVSAAVDLHGHHIASRDRHGCVAFEHFMLDGSASDSVLVRVLSLYSQVSFWRVKPQVCNTITAVARIDWRQPCQRDCEPPQNLLRVECWRQRHIVDVPLVVTQFPTSQNDDSLVGANRTSLKISGAIAEKLSTCPRDPPPPFRAFVEALADRFQVTLSPIEGQRFYRLRR